MFLTLEYSAQWAEMDSRMRRIEREKLRPDLEALCGAPFVAFLFETHEKYRAMIGAKSGAAVEAKTQPPAVAATLARGRKAITAHYVQLLAAYQAGGARVKAQLLPAFRLLDEIREKVLQGGAPQGPKDPPKDPVGPVAPMP